MLLIKSYLLIFVILTSNLAAKEKAIKFETQLLEPLGGKIEKPIDWFYEERHSGPSLIWILSKENPNVEAYTTGVKIQAIAGINEKTGKTPEKFIKDFINKKKTNVEILNECSPQQQDFFIRTCLGTIEEIFIKKKKNDFHIQYSLFWNNDMDMAIIVIAGTTKKLWPKYTKIFDKMNQLELINMERFEK